MRFGETKTKNNILNSSPQLTAMLIKARRLGCSKGQILNFLSFGYIPLPRGLEFHSAAREVDVVEGQALVGYGGPRGEAKTHAVICQVVFIEHAVKLDMTQQVQSEIDDIWGTD